jgi:hypothetical protein
MNFLKRVSLSILFLSYSGSSFAKEQDCGQGLTSENKGISQFQGVSENEKIPTEQIEKVNPRKLVNALLLRSIWAKDDFYLGNWKRGCARVMIAVVSIVAIPISCMIAYSIADSKKILFLGVGGGAGIALTLLAVSRKWSVSVHAEVYQKIWEHSKSTLIKNFPKFTNTLFKAKK